MSVQIIITHQGDFADTSVSLYGTLVIPDRRTCLERLPEIEQAARDSTRDLTVLVTNPVVASMLDFLRHRPGIRIKEANPLIELEQRWNCSLPSQLTAQMVETLQLLNVPPPLKGNALGIVLQRIYGNDIFLATSLTPLAEAELLYLLVQGHGYPDIANTIDSLLSQQLHIWGKQGSYIAETLAEQPKVAPWYIILSILRNYPSTIRQLVEVELASAFGCRPHLRTDMIEQLPLEPNYIPLTIKLPIEGALRQHLLAIPLADYLNLVSGILPVEFEILTMRAFDSPGVISLFSLRSVFAKLNISQTRALVELEQHWQLLTYSNFDIEEATRMKSTNSAFSELADFYVGRYLAMKDVHGSNPQGRERLLEWNEKYADWLVHNYHLLVAAHDPIFTSDQLSYRLRSLLTNNKVPLLWIIDGLAWPAFLRLSSMAEKAGFFLVSEPKACLAPIPTITEIGMTTLISGESPNTIARRTPNRNNWRAAREERFRQSYPGVKIGKANNPTQVYAALAMPAPIYLLQTLALDNAVHNDDLDEELFDAWLDLYFEKLCIAFAKSIDYPHLRKRHQDLVIIVTTDHGYTNLLHPGVAQLPSELRAAKDLFRVDVPHHCVLEVTLPGKATAEGNILRKTLSEQWYILEGDRFGLPDELTWIVPRKQLRTRAGSLRVHGRPSLEETIVPLAEFSLFRQVLLKIQLAIRGRLIKDIGSKVTLQITNYETWPIKDVTVEIPALGINTQIAKINPNSLEEIITESRPKQSGNLTAKARISSLGGPSQWVEVPAIVEQSDSERLLGEDRLAKFFDEEEF